MVKALTDSLSESGKSVRLYYIDEHIDPDLDFKVPVERLNPRKFPFEDFEIVHTNGLRPDFFAYINRNKIKYHISTAHSFIFEDLTYTYNRIISFLFGNIWLIIWKRADRLVCVSDSLRQYYQKWLPADKLSFIYNGVPELKSVDCQDDIIRETIGRFHSDGLKVIGSACNLNKTKGIDHILHLIAEDKKLGLIVIGHGKEYDHLKRLAANLKINERCFFSGFRSNARRYFKYFDLFIVPSRTEGFSLALVEAVEQRIPVVCSDLRVFQEMFSSNEVTFFSLSDKTSLLKAVNEAVATGMEKTALAWAGYRNKFTSRAMADNYLELYQSISDYA
jgi:glycosyltransferase involved in cell wall biosynthesis